MSKIIYLDNSATTPVAEVVKKKIPEWLELYGNPSSQHSVGRDAETAINNVRKTFKKYLPEHEIVFTSGATESNKIIIEAFGKCGCYSKFEHDSIYKRCQLFSKTIDRKYDLFCCQYINGETGNVIIGDVAHFPKGNFLWLCDATQSIGKVTFDRFKDADFITGSAHKFGGLKGTGFLAIKKKYLNMFRNDFDSQEFSIRGGTQNTLGILAMGEALEYAMENLEVLSHNRNMFIRDLASQFPDATINTKPEYYHHGILSISFPRTNAEVLTRLLDLEGVCISSHSACSKYSRIPELYNIPDGYGTIRISVVGDEGYCPYEVAKKIKKCLKGSRL